jgi:hypothetical protein
VRAGAAWLLSALLGAAAGCGDAPPGVQHAAPIAPRATLVLEPPRIGVGQVAVLELAVVTPPGHTPRPFAPPQQLPGLWLLDAETLPVEKQPSRWVHRTRLRLRARAVGVFAWPASTLQLEAPDGSLLPLALEERLIEVTSLLPEYPDRFTPFGVRAPPEPEGPAGNVWGPAAAGALAALACVGLVGLARRRRRKTPGVGPAPSPAPGPPPWERARSDFAQARELVAAEPFAAAHALALALRRYVTRRFRTDAAGRTSEELAAATPPFAATSRWPAFVAILGGLDELRFQPESDRAARDALSTRLAALLAEAEAFVDDSTPPEARR